MQFFSLLTPQKKLESNSFLVFSEVKDYLELYLSKVGADADEIATALDMIADVKPYERYSQNNWEKVADRIFKALRIPIASEQDLRKRNFGLSQAEYDALLKELRGGGQQLFEKVFLSHFDQCKKYVRSMYAMDEEDAYDITMDALVEFRRLLIETDKYYYKNLCYTFTLKAVQCFLRKKMHRDREKLEYIPEEVLREAVEEVEEVEFEEADMLKMEVAFDRMCDDCKALLSEFYYKGRKLKHIADEKGANYVAYRQRKKDCIKKLRKYFFQHHVPTE
jgi:RNA polymerase sigma factor (sigma-70 family)